MQDTTKRNKKWAAAVCAAVIVFILLLYAAVLFFPMLHYAYGETIAVVFVLVYGVLIAAVIIGVLTALYQRLKEINGGEEEDARQY